MPIHLALIALMLSPASPAQALPHSEVSHVAGWTLRAHPDRFTGQLDCRLTRGRVDYQRQAVVFHLSARIDTTTAIYRIDNGPPAWASNDGADLARLGFLLHDDDLANPSGGLVRIPEAKLLAAHAVQIETVSGQSPTRFAVDGLAAALEAARTIGCRTQDFDASR